VRKIDVIILHGIVAAAPDVISLAPRERIFLAFVLFSNKETFTITKALLVINF
jgi:hypothetical protein